MGKWLKENAVGLGSLAVTASGALVAFASDVGSAASEHPVEVTAIAIAAFFAGVAACWLVPGLRSDIERLRRRKVLADICAGLSGRQRAMVRELIDSGEFRARISDSQATALVVLGLADQPASGFDYFEGGLLTLGARYAADLRADPDRYLVDGGE